MQSVEIQGLDKVTKALEDMPGAVRAKAKTYLGGYAAGYITNALEGGHKVRQPSAAGSRSRAKTDRVPGKYMYRDTGQFEAERLAETAAQRIEDAALQKLNGGFG